MYVVSGKALITGYGSFFTAMGLFFYLLDLESDFIIGLYYAYMKMGIVRMV